MDLVKSKFNNNFFSFFIILFTLIGVFPNVYVFKYLPTLPKFMFRIICIMIILVLYLLYIIKNRRINILTCICAFFSIYQIVITIINRQDIITSMYSNTIISMSCLIITDVFIEYNKKVYIFTTVFYLLVMVIINAISGFFLTDANFTTEWFFGNRNDIFLYFIPLIFIVFLSDILNKNDNCFLQKKIYNDCSVLSIFVFAITIFTSFYARSLSSKVLITFYIFYLLFFSSRKISVINIYSLLLFVLITSIFFNLPFLNKLFFSKISLLLGKNTDANCRFEIYENILNVIARKNIIFGNGVPILEELTDLINTGNHSIHSITLDVLFKFGIVGFIFVFTILHNYINVLKKCNNLVLKNLSMFSIFIVLFWSIANTIFYFQTMFYLGLFTFFIGKYEYSFIDKKVVYISNEND